MLTVALVAWLPVSGSAIAAQGDWTPMALMETLAGVQEADLTFVESRSSAFLVDEVELTGRMKYIAPDFIEKQVETPYQHRIEIRGDNLLVEKTTNRGESKRQSYSLTASESLKTLVEGFRATLAGDLSSLDASYNIELKGTMSQWTVTLTPKTPEILSHIEKIALAGVEREIRSVETTNADGDVSTLTLSYQVIK